MEKIVDGRKLTGFKVTLTLISIIFIFIVSFSFFATAFAHNQLEGEKVPDFVTSTLDRKTFALMDWLQSPPNKVLVLAFFATWCELGEEDVKFLQRLQDQYSNEGLRVICVFTGRLSKIKAAKKFMEGMEIKLPVLLDEKRAISKRYQVTGLPCIYAIDREGFVRVRYVGFSEGAKVKLEKNLKDLLYIPDEE